MSEENVAIARRIYPGTFDMVALVAEPETAGAALGQHVHPDLETVFIRGQVPPGESVSIDSSSRPTSHGIDGFLAAFRDWLTAWESYVVTPTEFLDVDKNRVVVVIQIQARSKTHEVEIPLENGHILTFSDGKLKRLEFFGQRGEALEAAGLLE